MISRSEPLLLPLFFTFCIHFALLLLFGYWSSWESGTDFEDLSLGPSLKATLTNLPLPSKPVVKKESPPVPKKEEPLRETKEAPIQKEELTQPRESTLKDLVEELKETEPVVKEKVSPSPPPELQQEEREVDEAVLEEPKADISKKRRLRQEALAYYKRNQSLVEKNFNPGTTAQKQRFKGLVTRLKIFLDDKGRLVDMEIIRSSGNVVFDVEAERAVRRAGSFIVPDDGELRNEYFREITMEFSLK